MTNLKLKARILREVAKMAFFVEKFNA